MTKGITLYITIALVLGIAVGWVVNTNMTAVDAKSVADNLKIISFIFLQLIKMIIAPLVFATLISGIATMGMGAQLGRVGLRTIGWFLAASLMSMLLGLALVHFFQPGVGANIPLPEGAATGKVDSGNFTLQHFVEQVFPTSIVDAMAKNAILQIVVFSVFMGIALASLGERALGIVALAEQMVEVMLKITGYVMLFAPFGVFAAIAATIAVNGLGVLVTYAKFIGSFYAALLILWVLLTAAGFFVIGRRVVPLVGSMREPILLAFSTASSEAALPRILERLRLFGVPRRIAGFVLPLGYSFNLDGTAMYCTFATLFIAQVYGVELSLTQQALLVLILFVTSKGIAGVPRASLVVIQAALPFFNLPEAGILLILGVDQFLDMGRSGTNVIGNAVASAVQAKWEGELKDGPADEVLLEVVTIEETAPPPA